MAGVASMTGFAREAGELEGTRWLWEIKSVNGRGLEMRCRLPHGFDELELSLRNLAKKRLARGSLNANLNIETTSDVAQYTINEAALALVIDAAKRLENDHGFQPATADGVLALRGVFDVAESAANDDDRQKLYTALRDSFVVGLENLAVVRETEGEKMAAVIAAQLNEIATLTKSAFAHVDDANKMIVDKIRDQIKGILGDAAGPNEAHCPGSWRFRG